MTRKKLKSKFKKKCDFQKSAGSNSYMFDKFENQYVFLHSTDVCVSK